MRLADPVAEVRGTLPRTDLVEADAAQQCVVRGEDAERMLLAASARGHALLRNRSHVLPDDIQAVFVALAGHRLVAAGGEHSGQALAQMLLARVAVD